jgi:ABC-type Fe3+ transport system permease subunit
VLVGGLLLLLALPPSLSALGFIHLAGLSPSQLDPILRSQFTVSASLALRLVPIAAIFALRSFGASSPTWANAAALHGVPFPAYLRRVLVPWMSSAMLPAALLVALLALADVTTALLLHPPGKASLPLAIFTVMANAPESLVGALCVTYVAGAALALVFGITLTTRRKTNL